LKRETSTIPIVFTMVYPFPVLEMAELETAARSLGLDVAPFEIRRAEDIAPAFEALKGRAEALYVVGDALVTTHRIRINTLALPARLPTIHVVRESVETSWDSRTRWSDLYESAIASCFGFAVATSREGHRQQIPSRAGQHRQWGLERWRGFGSVAHPATS